MYIEVIHFSAFALSQSNYNDNISLQYTLSQSKNLYVLPQNRLNYYILN